MSVIDIRYEGTSITNDVEIRRTSFTALSDGRAGQAIIRVRDKPHLYLPGYFHAGGTLTLHIDGSREWDGWVFIVGRSWAFDVDDTSNPTATPRFWTLTGLDRNVLFTKRKLYRVADPADPTGLRIWPQGTSDKQALDHALTHYVDLSGDGLDIESGIRQIASPGPYEEFSLGFVGADFGVLFADAAKITGGVFAIDPDRIIRYAGDTDVTAPFILSDVPGAGRKTYREAEAADDFMKAATEALIWGAGKGSPDPVFAKYRHHVGTYGLWQYGEVFPGAWKQKTVKRRAETYVDGSPSHRRGHGEPIPQVSVVIHEPGIRAAHVVDFRMETFDYQANLPVRELKMTFPNPTSVRYEITLSLDVDTPFGGTDLWPIPNIDLPPIRGVTPPLPPRTPRDTVVDQSWLIDDFERPCGPLSYTTLTGFSTESSEHFILLPDGEKEAGDVLFAYIVLRDDIGYTGSIDGWTWRMGNSIPPATTNLFFYVVTGLEGFTGTGDVVTYESSLETQIGFVSGLVKCVAGFPNDVSALISDYDEPLAVGDNIELQSGPDTPPPGQNLFFVSGVRAGTDAWIGPPIQTPDGLDAGFDTVALSSPQANNIEPFILAAKYSDDSTAGPLVIPAAIGHDPVNGDGSTMAFGFHWRGDVLTQDLGLTPGPGVTGAPWPGGNPYSRLTDGEITILTPAGVPSDIWGLQDSLLLSEIGDPDSWNVFYSPAGTRWFLDTTFTYDLPDPDVPDPWSPLADAENVLLFRFRLASPEAPFAIELFQTSDDEPEWYRDDVVKVATDGLSLIQGVWPDPAWERTTTIARAIELDTWYLLAVTNASGDRTNEDIEAALAASEYVMCQAVIDYYGGVPGTGTGIKAPLRGFGTTKVALWKETDDPPQEWDILTEEFRYATTKPTINPTGEPCIPPDGANPTYLMDPLLLYINGSGIQIFEGGAELDWYRSLVASTGPQISTVTYLSSTDTTSTYFTPFPYRPLSLMAWLAGSLLLPDADFIESDPLAGLLILNDPLDQSANLLVRYDRYGEVLTHVAGYRPAPVLQYGWGSRLDGANALMACSVMALDRQTLGAHTPFRGAPLSTPPYHRELQFDQTGGGDLFDIRTAWSRGWGETLESPGIHDWGTFASRVAEGRGAILQGRYESLPEDKRSAQSFGSAHALYINEILPNGSYWGADPLTGAGSYTAEELMAYAAGLSWVDDGFVSAGFTRIT